MKLLLCTVIALLFAPVGNAALDNGALAPPFDARASIAGEEFDFSLAEALQRGPVVVYFYPKAFTKGCTIEARNFAKAIDQFASLETTVIGVSGDDIATLNKFSASECNGKFAVASDSNQAIMKAYDAVLPLKLPYANRTSYVVTPGGKIYYSYTSIAPDEHVANTLAALRRWHKESRAE